MCFDTSEEEDLSRHHQEHVLGSEPNQSGMPTLGARVGRTKGMSNSAPQKLEGELVLE